MKTSTLSIQRWKQKVAVVTGASAGCGASIAEALAKNGITVVGLARRKEKLEVLTDKLKNEEGKFYSIKVDITIEEDILNAFKWIEDNIGPISILVNNAGISQPTTISDGSTEMWKKVLDTNVLGLAICTREAIRSMRKNMLSGHIIHINSVIGHYVPHIPKLNFYPASKFAVTALTETLRQELMSVDDTIKISSVSPGPVETEFAEANNLYTNKSYEEFFKVTPKLDAKDIADAVIYVLSTPPQVQVQELTIRPVIERV